MIDNRDKWVFIKQNDKRIISDINELKYWKDSLKKILKIGIEFEYNLPEPKGSCDGNSPFCPCKHMKIDTCWRVCEHEAVCANSNNYEICTNKTDECTPLKCEKCKNFNRECLGIDCIDFVSSCITCENYTIDCNSCEYKYNREDNPESIRTKMINDLKPNKCYGVINNSGVHSIVPDGSLLGDKGMEVITIGRRVDFWEFYKMAKNIIDKATIAGAYVNERCSIHMHVLASYYGKMFENGQSKCIPSVISELEKDMPEIVLANFHQLIRRYQNAITWMSMALDNPKRMTRWEKFRVSVLPISAALNSMHVVKDNVGDHAGGNKYGFVNYKFIKFDNANINIKRFHIEMRVNDGILSSSAVASFACLYYALVIKAVEISRYGLLEVGDKKWMNQTNIIKEALLNNNMSYEESNSTNNRFSDTKHLHNYFDILINESLDLICQLKSILIKIGPAYQVLEKLAEKPIALRRIEGKSWKEIEEDIGIKVNMDGLFDIKLNECIDLRLIIGCKDINEWMAAVSKILKEDPDLHNLKTTINIDDKINKYVQEHKDDGDLIWSKSQGTIMGI